MVAGAKAFALDTRSKRRWECPPLQRATAAAFRAACNKFGLSSGQILPHGEQQVAHILINFPSNFLKYIPSLLLLHGMDVKSIRAHAMCSRSMACWMPSNQACPGTRSACLGAPIGITSVRHEQPQLWASGKSSAQGSMLARMMSIRNFTCIHVFVCANPMESCSRFSGSYLINLGSPDAEMLRKSYAAFLEELQRCEALGIRLYNIHPGHTNSCGETSTPEQCMDLIADCINRAHGETSGVTVVLENVAGQVGLLQLPGGLI